MYVGGRRQFLIGFAFERRAASSSCASSLQILSLDWQSILGQKLRCTQADLQAAMQQ